MSGPDIVRSLATRRPGLRVLFVSGHPRDEDLSVGSAVWDYLEKPFRPAALIVRVRVLLDRPLSQEALPRALSIASASVE